MFVKPKSYYFSIFCIFYVAAMALFLFSLLLLWVGKEPGYFLLAGEFSVFFCDVLFLNTIFHIYIKAVSTLVPHLGRTDSFVHLFSL